LVAASVGFVGTITAFVLEYHYLQTADANAPHYYTNVLPSWLQGSQGYNYVATGVVLSLVSIVVVSLLTARPKAEQLASLEPVPIENYSQFVAQTSQASPQQGKLASK
jgi:hypothetical protein